MANYRVIFHDGMEDGDHLEHFGIKGMKWGVRRYQNPDGSLTEAGKKRMRKDQDRLNSETYRQASRKAQYKINEKTALEGRNYGRWYTSGATSSQRRLIKQKDKRLSKMLDKSQKKYNVKYNTSTGQYTFDGYKQKTKTESKISSLSERWSKLDNRQKNAYVAAGAAATVATLAALRKRSQRRAATAWMNSFLM